MKGIAMILILAGTGLAQSGPPYEITQSVIANGGAVSTDGGGQYSITGTLGQAVAGTRSTGSPYQVRGGFWQAFFAPTAAMVSISGQAVDSFGNPIGRARVILDDGGGIYRTAITNAFGNFQFDDVQLGRTYIVSATHRRFHFTPQAISVFDEISDLSLIGLE
jgi:hypothetical protein